MNLKINRYLLTQTRWDSGSINPLASVLHRFEIPGTYPGVIYRDKEALGVFDLVVNEAAPDEQVNIDLEAVQKSRFGHGGGNFSFRVNPRQPTLFYVPRGPVGYSVVVYRSQDRNAGVEFDNRELNAGDVFMLAPIHPGVYLASNKGTTRMEITVQKREGRSIPTQPVMIACTERGFTPEKVACEFSQPLFFVIQAPSRITIWIEKRFEVERKYNHRLSHLKQKGILP
jgi:hypothetical protein